MAGLEFRDEADTVNALIPELRRRGVQSIVVLIHQGGFQTGSLSDINGCEGSLAGSAIASIVSRLSDEVDAVVSGHTHAAYNCTLPNAKGRLIPVTELQRVRPRVDRARSYDRQPLARRLRHQAVNSLVDRTDATVTPNAAILDIVNGYNALVSPIANQVIGSITQAISNTAADHACNMPAGDLIADAQLAATARNGFGNAVIAFMNRGVRNPGFTFASGAAGEGDGNVTLAKPHRAHQRPCRINMPNGRERQSIGDGEAVVAVIVGHGWRVAVARCGGARGERWPLQRRAIGGSGER